MTFSGERRRQSLADEPMSRSASGGDKRAGAGGPPTDGRPGARPAHLKGGRSAQAAASLPSRRRVRSPWRRPAALELPWRRGSSVSFFLGWKIAAPTLNANVATFLQTGDGNMACRWQTEQVAVTDLSSKTHTRGVLDPLEPRSNTWGSAEPLSFSPFCSCSSAHARAHRKHRVQDGCTSHFFNEGFSNKRTTIALRQKAEFNKTFTMLR